MYFFDKTKTVVLDDFVDQLITPPVKQEETHNGLLVNLDDGRSIMVAGFEDQTGVYVDGNSITPNHHFVVNDLRSYREFKAWALTY